mgnify:FL=1
MKDALTVEEIKRRAVPVLKHAGVTRSAVFGSAARGQMKPESDVDLLIAFDGKKSLLDLVDLQQQLESALERRVDLITYRSVYPRLRAAIEKDEVAIL